MTARLFTTVAVSAILASTAAVAQEKTLRLAHNYPANHYLVEHGMAIFMEEIERETDGAIKFEVYPAGQLGRDNIGNLASGLTEIAYMAQSVESTALVLSTATELPGVYQDACEGGEIAASLMREDGLIGSTELAERGIHWLYTSAFAHYDIFSGPTPLNSFDDLVGMKVRGGGAAINKALREIGAVPIQVPGGELYDALQRGILDAAFWPTVAIPTYDLQNVMASAISGTNLGGTAPFLGMSVAAWNDLTEEQQQIFMDAGVVAQQHFCEWIETATQEVMDSMVNDHGMKLITLTDEEYAELQETLAPVRNDWAAEMEAAGRPGNAVLEAMDAFAANR